MPKTKQVTIEISDTAGHQTTLSAEYRVFTPEDGRMRAFYAGGVVFAVALVMLPIPIVHFGAIPVLLVGLPVVMFAVNRLYRSGADIKTEAECPSCHAKIRLEVAAEYWPINRVCMTCRSPYTIKCAELSAN